MVRPLFVANFSEVIGGGELSLIDLVRGLTERGLAPLVVVPSPSDGRSIPSLLSDHSDRIVVPYSIPGMAFAINKICAAASPAVDLVHATGARGLTAAAMARTGKRIVWHVRVAARDKIDFILRHLPDTIIANSKATAGRFTGQDNVRVVYNGIRQPLPPSDRLFNSEAGGGRQSSKVRIGVIGRMTPEKGHADLIDIIPDLLNRLPRAEIVFVGENQTAIGRRLADLAVLYKDRIVLTGPVPAIADHMTEFDLVLIPSRIEGFGRVAVEALRSGVTVAATRVGGLREILADLDRLFLPDQRVEWCDAICRLISDPPYSSGILKRYGDQYDIDRHIDDIVAIYDEIIAI